MYNLHKVTKDDSFQYELYPNAVDELEEIRRNTLRMSGHFKSEIIISYLKDHSLDMHWIAKNPKLAKYITSRLVSTSHLESLFESCRENNSFLNEFEAFVRTKLQ